MPSLTLLNGPPGCGKSTLAQMYVTEHPLSLNLDIDRIRRLVGDWQDRPEESGLLARQIALATAQVHLRAGHDVVVPQYVGKVDFIEQLEQAARGVPADFHEVVLLTSKEDALRRFDERGRAAADRVHVEARQMAEAEGGPSAVADMYDRLLEVLAKRPHAIVIRAQDGDANATYQRLLSVLA